MHLFRCHVNCTCIHKRPLLLTHHLLKEITRGIIERWSYTPASFYLDPRLEVLRAALIKIYIFQDVSLGP
jgi:hypothetical protein